MSRSIVVIDYGLANIRSVVNALSCFRLPVEVAEQGRELANAAALVLPGVGSFDMGMRNLRARGHVDALQELVVERDVPFLGICLGLQFALEGSEEGDEPGMGWFPHTARRLPTESPDGRVVKVPHIGWNEVDIANGGELLEGIGSGTDFYFNHSYYFPRPDGAADTDALLHTTNYGLGFVSAVERGNVSLVQFHPEKSQLAGMKLLENFVSHLMVAEDGETA